MAPKKNKATKEAPKPEPAAKKAKVEEKKAEAPKKEEPKKEEPKPMEVEPEEEKELDDKEDKRPALKETIAFDPLDSTLNVVPCGKVLMSLTEGGMQHLIAGARATVGMKAGRYVFEVKIIQSLNLQGGAGGQTPKPRNLIRVGFSSAGSSLILGDEDSVYFDGEGFFFEGKKKQSTMAKPLPGLLPKFGTGAVVAILLNLDSKSPNANTISLFKDGVRISDPKPLPENLKGKPLFPHISFRNVSVQVNFGPLPLKALPFKCRLLGSAAKADTAATLLSTPKDGKYELVLPVAFPDEGTFDWLDTYLEKNPQYVELSDRKIIEWAKKSGLYYKGSGGWKQSHTNDKPAFNFGVPDMENFSVRKVINSIAPLVPRNYLVMEVKSNLLPDERKAILSRFNYPQYKKIAHVVMGEPDDKFKEKTWEKLLSDKQKSSDIKFKAQKAEEKRKKVMEKRKKELDKAKAKAEKIKKKALEEKKKAEEEKKAKEEAEKKAKEAAKEAAKEGEAKKEEDKKEEKKEEKEEKKEEEKKEEKKEDADDDDEEEKDEPMEEEKEEDPPIVELTDEDKKQFFLKKGVPDLAPAVLSTAFSKFATPEADEGFDEIRYEWQPAEKAKDYLKTWVQERKLTQRIDNLQPSEKSKTKIQDFKKSMTELQEKHAAHKKTPPKAAKDGDKAPDVDIFAVENISDVGGGVPLYKDFGPEDWVLMQLRFELFHLTKAFKEDTGDAERVIHEDHLVFYYQKYYGKSLSSKPYGVDSTKDVIGIVKDTVTIEIDKKIVHTSLEDTESFDIFVKLTEEARRERQRRIDAGDETARLGLAESLLKSVTPGKPPEAKAEAAKAGKKGEGKGKMQYAPKKPVVAP
mmetsp:Transcript_109157/g.204746  ORF Transcript_109157/g.204746 Transcript_109157/m.204746 type:complete len:858 (-) Transcript_109157:335-2908(-)